MYNLQKNFKTNGSIFSAPLNFLTKMWNNTQSNLVTFIYYCKSCEKDSFFFSIFVIINMPKNTNQLNN